eukprot:5717305-Alexandrium_andersonii.AAC.1
MQMRGTTLPGLPHDVRRAELRGDEPRAVLGVRLELGAASPPGSPGTLERRAPGTRRGPA